MAPYHEAVFIFVRRFFSLSKNGYKSCLTVYLTIGFWEHVLKVS